MRTKFILKRFGLSLVSIYVIATILFLMFRLAPGDPTQLLVDPAFGPEIRENLRARWGLDDPLYVQYVRYMANLVQGDMGVSFLRTQPVRGLILDRLPNTLVLMLTGVLLAFFIGPFFGALFAWRRDSRLDVIGTGAILITYAAPAFWVGMMGLMLFSFRLGWVPAGGMRSVGSATASLSARYLSWDFLHHLVLPLTVVTLYWMTIPTFLMRNNMIDVMDADFIRLKEAEGLSEYTILYKHAARNAMLPVLHYAAVAIGFAFGGSIIIETVFSWPGVGQLMWKAVTNHDYPLAQGIFLLIASMVVLMNFFVDVISVYVDPRTAENAG